MLQRRPFGLRLFALFALSALVKLVVYYARGPTGPAVDDTESSDEIIARDAPKLRVAGWLGEAPAFDPARPQLLVSWCSRWEGCVEDGGFVSVIHDRYAGRVDVFAVSAEPREKLLEVDGRLRRAGMARTFPVAIDLGEEEGTLPDLAATYNHDFIILPYAWLIAKGRVLWHGDVEDADAALVEVLETGDAAKARSAKRDIDRLKQAYLDADADGDARLGERADALYAALKGRPGQALHVALDLRDVDSDQDFVLKLAELANAGTFGKCSGTLNVLALAQWDAGDAGGAIKTQTEVIRLCDALAFECKEEREYLKIYQAPLDAGDAGGADESVDAGLEADAGDLDAGKPSKAN